MEVEPQIDVAHDRQHGHKVDQHLSSKLLTKADDYDKTNDDDKGNMMIDGRL